MEYGYQGLDPGSKVQYLLHGIRFDKLSKVVAAVSAHSDKYLPSGRRPVLAMALPKVRSSQKNSRDECDLMLMAQ